MAMILKQGKSYPDPYNGNSETCYLNIKDVNGNANRKSQHITVEIYSSKEAREAGKRPVDRKSHNISGDDWDAYFAPNSLNSENKNQYSQSYKYIKALEENIGTEEEPEVVLVYKDWKDEI